MSKRSLSNALLHVSKHNNYSTARGRLQTVVVFYFHGRGTTAKQLRKRSGNETKQKLQIKLPIAQLN